MAQGKWTANKIARLVGLGLMVGGCLFVLFWNPPEKEVERPKIIRPAKLHEVQTVGEAVSRSYTGVVRASTLVDLAFRVAGPLVELPIDRGQEVEAGDVIAQIDPRDFQTKLAEVTSSLEKAQANLDAMKAGAREEVVLRLKNKIRAAKADLENAEIELTRYQKLLDEGVISQSEYDGIRLRRDTAMETKEAAEQELVQAEKGARQEDIDAQEALLRGLEAQKRDAENAVADTSMKAPFAGRIAKQFVENFQDVRAGQVIVSLQDVDQVEIVADIPESIVAVVKRHNIKSLEVTFPSLPDRSFPVELKEMETEADRRTQTYALTVTMPSPDDVNLLAGMPAELHIAMEGLGDKEAGVIVPVTAVFADEARNPYVWITTPVDGTEGVFDVKRVPVTVDTMSGTQILVTEGLKGGELIVTAGVHFLDAETQVRRLQVEP